MIWLDVITAEGLPGPMRLRVRGRSMLPTLRPGDEVVIHPVPAEALVRGDWVVVRGAQGAFLHRYLGQRHGYILTKGDGHRGFDPVWPPDAVLGRVVEAQRDGRCFYRRAAGQLWRERLLTAGHHILGDVWGVLRRVKALLLALCAVVFATGLVWAAVTLTSFTAEVGEECEGDTGACIVLEWETASETSNLGFRLHRSLTENSGYVDISGFIVSLDEGAGAFYVHEDAAVTPGTTYYYRLEDVPDDGTAGDYTNPISATIPLTETVPTLTPTTTSTPSPSPTPNPNARFWASKTDLTAGECATLYWQTNNITAVFFDNAGVSGDGERVFCPCAAESHTLRVKYASGVTEDFVINLNVTGQCGTVAPGSTPTLTPRATTVAPATVTPPATSAPVAFATQAVTVAPVALTVEPIETPEVEVQAMAEPLAPPLAADTLPADISPSPVTPMPTLLPTRGSIAGGASGVPVDNLLSVWLLIVGGIIGAGFIGAGILMWKRQQ